MARCLLNYEAVSGKISESAESATLRVYGKLREGLGELAGVAGFESLASRALALAKTEAPSLSAVRVSADGELLGFGQGLGAIEHQMNTDKDRVGESPVGEGGVLFIARLLGLLVLFLGEALTLSLLRVTWPGAALDDCISENGRKT
jgi:hypothetical protein